MPLPKPSTKPAWTDSSPAARVEPSSGKKASGWAVNERPPFQYMNWLFYIIGSEWLNYFESVTDAYAAYQNLFAAFVGTGPGATHATINAAMADVGAGDVILVLDSSTINTPQVISKNRVKVVFMPGAIYTKGTSQYGLQIQADYVKIEGGEFEGFSGVSDAGIKIDSGADFVKIRDSHFRTCTVDVQDDAATSSILGTTTEV